MPTQGPNATIHFFQKYKNSLSQQGTKIAFKTLLQTFLRKNPSIINQEIPLAVNYLLEQNMAANDLADYAFMVMNFYKNLDDFYSPPLQRQTRINREKLSNFFIKAAQESASFSQALFPARRSIITTMHPARYLCGQAFDNYVISSIQSNPKKIDYFFSNSNGVDFRNNLSIAAWKKIVNISPLNKKIFLNYLPSLHDRSIAYQIELSNAVVEVAKNDSVFAQKIFAINSMGFIPGLFRKFGYWLTGSVEPLQYLIGDDFVNFLTEKISHNPSSIHHYLKAPASRFGVDLRHKLKPADWLKIFNTYIENCKGTIQLKTLEKLFLEPFLEEFAVSEQFKLAYYQKKKSADALSQQASMYAQLMPDEAYSTPNSKISTPYQSPVIATPQGAPLSRNSSPIGTPVVTPAKSFNDDSAEEQQSPSYQ